MCCGYIVASLELPETEVLKACYLVTVSRKRDHLSQTIKCQFYSPADSAQYAL